MKGFKKEGGWCVWESGRPKEIQTISLFDLAEYEIFARINQSDLSWSLIYGRFFKKRSISLLCLILLVLTMASLMPVYLFWYLWLVQVCSASECPKIDLLYFCNLVRQILADSVSPCTVHARRRCDYHLCYAIETYGYMSEGSAEFPEWGYRPDFVLP